jgi:hypothetical protein
MITLSCEKSYLAEIFAPLGKFTSLSLSLLCYGLYLSSGDKWYDISWRLFSCYGYQIFLVNKGLSNISFEIGKKKLHIVSSSFLFHGFSWLDPWRNKRAYALHQVYHFCLLNNPLQRLLGGVKGITPSYIYPVRVICSRE